MLGVLLCQGLLGCRGSNCARRGLACWGSHYAGGVGMSRVCVGGIWMLGLLLCWEEVGMLEVSLCWGTLECQGPAVPGCWYVGVLQCWGELGLPVPCRAGAVCGKGDNAAGSALALSQVGGHCKNIPTLEYGFLVQVSPASCYPHPAAQSILPCCPTSHLSTSYYLEHSPHYPMSCLSLS